MDKNIKIGIIGAGAAGLSAAFYLKQEGYNNIKILEREERVGGKCCSIEHEGRVFELGAVLGSSNYDCVQEIMECYDIPKGSAPGHGFYNFKDEGLHLLVKQEEKGRLFYEQYVKYRGKLHGKYRRILKPGLDRMNPELFEIMDDWAEDENLRLLAKSFTPLTPAYGYGYFDETPAMYYIKYIQWPQYLSFFHKSEKFSWKNGIQNLWKEVSKDFHVEMGVNIQSINRSRVVRVITDNDEYEFDKIIISSPLDEALQFLDSRKEERDIFSRIKTIDYRIFICKVTGLTKNIGYLLPNVDSSKRGYPMVWYCRYPDRNIYNFYVVGTEDLDDEDILQNIEETLVPFGGKVEEVIRKKRWKYFPHFLTDDLKDGVYDRIEKMQGRNNTYYVGEVMNFSSVEFTSRYSENLVERFF